MRRADDGIGLQEAAGLNVDDYLMHDCRGKIISSIASRRRAALSRAVSDDFRFAAYHISGRRMVIVMPP